MANVLEFTHPATGLRHKITLPTPAIDLNVEGNSNNFPQMHEAALFVSANIPSATGVAARSVEARLNLYGLYHDLLFGGPGVPPGVLQDRLAVLAADVAGAAASITVDRYATDWSGVSTNFIAASQQMLLMHRLPNPGESIWTAGVTNCAAEIVTVDAGYTGSTTVALGTGEPVTARKAGAVLVPLTAPCASYYPAKGFDKGVIYELERPAAAAITTAIQGTGSTINVSFSRSAHERTAAGTYDSRTGYGVVSHYAFFVLKKGNLYSTYAPEMLAERAQPSEYDNTGQVSAVLAIDAAKFTEVSGVVSIAGLNRYWDSTDNALKAITAGTYFVGLVARNQAGRDRACRESNVSWSSAVVVS